MNIYEQINELLSDKENYKVEKGKFFLKDMFDEWSEKKPNSLGVIDVRGLKFTADDLGTAISGKIVVAEITPEAYEGKIENRIEQDELTQFASPKIKVARGSAVTIKIEKKNYHPPQNKSRNTIRSAEIKIIRKMLSEKKSINAISKALGVPRFPVMYIVKKIKKGEKLKHE